MAENEDAGQMAGLRNMADFEGGEMSEKKEKPTIAELEAILDGKEGPYGGVEIMPDGSLRAIRADEIADLRTQLAAHKEAIKQAVEALETASIGVNCLHNGFNPPNGWTTGGSRRMTSDALAALTKLLPGDKG